MHRKTSINHISKYKHQYYASAVIMNALFSLLFSEFLSPFALREKF